MGKVNKTALKNSLFTALYVIAVGSFMYLGGEAKIGRANSFLVPVSFLLLFVCSAGITGYLLFGKPILLYIDGKKKAAVSLVTHTLIYFAAITILAIILLVVFTR